MRKLICVLLVLSMLFSLAGCSGVLGNTFFLFLVAMGDDGTEKDDVFEFVCEEEKALLKAIENGDFSSFENKTPLTDLKYSFPSSTLNVLILLHPWKLFNIEDTFLSIVNSSSFFAGG